MADSFSFDVVSEVDDQEVINAVNQANKEHQQRFDLKNTDSSIEFIKADHELTVCSKDEYTLNCVLDILKSKLVKRGISLKALNPGTLEDAQSGTVRQKITFQQGIPTDKAKEMVKDIKATKMKVQAQIMDGKVRVSGKKKDDLQEVKKLVQGKDYDIHVDFGNYR